MPRCASGFCKWMNQVSPLTSDLLVSGSSSGPIQVHNQLLSVLAKSSSSSQLAHFLLFLQYSAILITPDPSFTFTELGDSVFIIAKFHREQFVECGSCRVSRNHSYHILYAPTHFVELFSGQDELKWRQHNNLSWFTACLYVCVDLFKITSIYYLLT